MDRRERKPRQRWHATRATHPTLDHVNGEPPLHAFGSGGLAPSPKLERKEPEGFATESSDRQASSFPSLPLVPIMAHLVMLGKETLRKEQSSKTAFASFPPEGVPGPSSMWENRRGQNWKHS